MLTKPCFANAENNQTAINNKPLGRLFNQASEREHLDNMRNNHTTIQKPTIMPHQRTTYIAPTPLVLPQPITLQGYVKRNDGRNTLWINNQTVQENSHVESVEIGKLRAPSNINNKRHANGELLGIKIPATGKQIQLKAGQRYDPETNQIKEITTLAREKQLQLNETSSNDEGLID